MQTLGYVALVVRDYDEAVKFFTESLGFHLIEDTVQGPGKRWVLVAPPNSRGTSLLLAQASTQEQASRIGNQTGGRVFLFLHTDDFWRDYRQMKARGIKFPRDAARRTVWNGRSLRRPLRQSLGPIGTEAQCRPLSRLSPARDRRADIQLLLARQQLHPTASITTRSTFFHAPERGSTSSKCPAPAISTRRASSFIFCLAFT
jgi:catechol 2,3-dioxygenase-like lactoylglutathione lyase family enzyme